MFIIPFREPAEWKEQITLTGVIFILEFKWNALNEFWMMNVYTGNEEPLILGVKIVPNFNLLYAFTVFGKPAGDIVCQNIVGSNDEISRFDMSQKFELVYYEPGELASIPPLEDDDTV